MLSVEQVKELIAQPDISDEDAETIRDSCRSLVEIIFEKWIAERSMKKLNEDENSEQKNNNRTPDCK